MRGTSLLSLEEHLPSDRGSDIPLMDTLAGDEGDLGAGVEQREVREALVRAVEALPRQERTVIKLYYFEGQTLKDIKAVLAVSESRVSQIHAQAVIHLARSYGCCAPISASARTIRRSSRNTCGGPHPLPGAETRRLTCSAACAA